MNQAGDTIGRRARRRGLALWLAAVPAGLWLAALAVASVFRRSFEPAETAPLAAASDEARFHVAVEGGPGEAAALTAKPGVGFSGKLGGGSLFLAHSR